MRRPRGGAGQRGCPQHARSCVSVSCGCGCAKLPPALLDHPQVPVVVKAAVGQAKAATPGPQLHEAPDGSARRSPASQPRRQRDSGEESARPSERWGGLMVRLGDVRPAHC